MKKLLTAALAVCTLFVTSCGGGSGSDPKATLISFFDAMSKKDFTAAKKMATKESESMFSMMEMAMKMGGDKGKDDMKFDKAQMEFGDAKIEGDKATVAVKDKKSGESTNFILKKEDGSWKVAFDKSSMMQMGMEKAKEKGMDDSLDMQKLEEGLNKLKDMNTDSIGKALKDGVKALDSANEMMKELKK